MKLKELFLDSSYTKLHLHRVVTDTHFSSSKSVTTTIMQNIPDPRINPPNMSLKWYVTIMPHETRKMAIIRTTRMKGPLAILKWEHLQLLSIYTVHLSTNFPHFARKKRKTEITIFPVFKKLFTHSVTNKKWHQNKQTQLEMNELYWILPKQTKWVQTWYWKIFVADFTQTTNDVKRLIQISFQNCLEKPKIEKVRPNFFVKWAN